MRNPHEYVYYQDGLPIRVFAHSQNYVPLHWHKEVEIIVVLAGRSEVSIGQIHLDAEEGDVIVVNCNEIHGTSSLAGDPYLILGLQIDPEFCGVLLPDISRVWFRNCHFQEEGKGRQGREWMRYCLSRLLWESIERREGYPFALQSMVYSVICQLMRTCRQPVGGTEALDVVTNEFRGLRPILDHIDSHYTEKLSMHDVAEAHGMSPYYLAHLFKAKVGVSFNQYLNGIRVAKALDLLAYSDQRIVDIIYGCGFSGPEFFYRTFREKQHCTPLEYRRRYRSARPGEEDASGGPSSSNATGVSKDLTESIVERLLWHLQRFDHDRRFVAEDKDRLLEAIRKNDPRKKRYFASVHFTTVPAVVGS